MRGTDSHVDESSFGVNVNSPNVPFAWKNTISLIYICQIYYDCVCVLLLYILLRTHAFAQSCDFFGIRDRDR